MAGRQAHAPTSDINDTNDDMNDMNDMNGTDFLR